MEGLHLGIDVGSASANTVLLGPGHDVAYEEYTRTQGQPLETVAEVLSRLLKDFPASRIASASFAGSGGKLLADLLGGNFVNEIIAQARAIEHYHPEVRTIIEIGGEDSKFILLARDGQGRVRIEDFAMNTLCAAGTGSFLDQQASRLGLSIQDFSRLALQSESPPRIAGRCSVFAKSDMIHLQQEATPDYDIVAGLCFALARNLKSNIGKGKKILRPVSFQGGVAANLGVRRALSQVMDLGEGDLIIPERFLSMGAIGSILITLDVRGGGLPKFRGVEALLAYLGEDRGEVKHHKPLVPASSRCLPAARVATEGKAECYLGVDVGSISTKVVVIDDNCRLVAGCYLLTAGKPLESIKQGLREIGGQVAGKVKIVGAGTTGSGRYLIADFIGADVVKNEITAQATAAAFIDPEVDTIFEIGGQDSKFISLENGAVVDFQMNKVCAAGTGSFLEEQADRLGVSIKGEFGALALASRKPVPLGERCTVFMKSDLVHHQQRGLPKADLIAGLSYAIVHNYLNKVVEDRRIGQRIFFQGATAANEGVVAAFESVLGQKVTVPPDHHITGAIGAAILAKRERTWKESRFKGFDASERAYATSTFECKGCANGCEIKKVSIESEKALFYGGRCERYEVDKSRNKGRDLPDLFEEREAQLIAFSECTPAGSVRRGTIGIPRTLFFHENLPFWSTLFARLGFEVVVTDTTTKKVVRQGCERISTETCFPLKVAHGHVFELLERGVDYLFLPSVVRVHWGNPRLGWGAVCPYVQSLPYTLPSSVVLRDHGTRMLQPVVHFGLGSRRLASSVLNMTRELNIGDHEARGALAAAQAAQEGFDAYQSHRGREVLAELGPDEKAIVIVSRPYNGYDPGVNLRLPGKIKELGIKALPLDFLPIRGLEGLDSVQKMYWVYGQKILSAAEIIRRDPRLFAVYITNFACGPDSFVQHFFRDHVRGKPYLEIEIDEHSADAGAVTRLEAYLDSLSNVRPAVVAPQPVARADRVLVRKGERRRLYLPYMTDHVFALAAAYEACGVAAEVLPEPDHETLDLGRKLTSGKECYPCILTTGDMAKRAMSPDFAPAKAAFFMPSGQGPCRFGQYHRFHRMVLDDLGFADVPIYAPDQDDELYNELQLVDGDFSRLAWQGIVAVDLLEKKLRRVRPYEKEKGSADSIYRRQLKAACQAVKGRQDLARVLRQAREEFEGLPLNESGRRPIVGIVGEIYIRCNRFANEDIIRHLEGLGGEVWMPPLLEWFLYCNMTARDRQWRRRKYRQFVKLLLTEHVQKRLKKKLETTFKGSLSDWHEPHVEETLRLAAPFIHRSFEGEAILSVGKTVEFVERGASGLVNVMPFTCMPGTIVHSILKHYREQRHNIPFLNMAYDGQEQTNSRTRLEAFMFQVAQFDEARRRD
ncbi:MAG: acyl-CoA dehydratase activase [Pseudomonadota bacterium]